MSETVLAAVVLVGAAEKSSVLHSVVTQAAAAGEGDVLCIVFFLSLGW